MKLPRPLLVCALALPAGWLTAHWWARRPDTGNYLSTIAASAERSLTDQARAAFTKAEVSRLLHDPAPDAVEKLAAQLARLTPADTVAMLEDLDRTGFLQGGATWRAGEVLAAHLARIAPELALQTALRLPRVGNDFLASALGEGAVRESPSRAAQWGAQLDKLPWARTEKFWDAFGAHASTEKLEALRAGSPERKMATVAFVRHLTETDPAAAKKYAENDPGLRPAIAKSLALRSPQDALAWLASCPPGPETTRARGCALGVMAGQDLTAALTALNAEDSPQLLSSAMSPLSLALAAQPPERVLAALQQFPDLLMASSGTMEGTLAGAWLHGWNRRDPAGSAAFLFSQEPSALRDDLIGKWAQSWPNSDDGQSGENLAIRQGLERILTSEPPGDARTAGMGALALGSAGDGDDAMAFQWWHQQPEEARARTVRRMASRLADSNPAGLAGHWQELPAATQTDLRQEMLDNWRLMDPSAADAWIKSEQPKP